MRWINLEVKSGSLCSFKHILVHKLRGTTTGILKKLLKVITSSFQAERPALEDILGNSLYCLLAVSFGKSFHTLHQRVDRVRFFLENPDYVQLPKKRSQGG